MLSIIACEANKKENKTAPVVENIETTTEKTDDVGTSLIEAVKSGDLEKIKLLIDNGANANILVHNEDKSNKEYRPIEETALIVAAENG